MTFEQLKQIFIDTLNVDEEKLAYEADEEIGRLLS